MGGSLTRSLLTKLSGASSSRAAIVNGVSMMVLLPYMGIISQTPKVTMGSKPLRSFGLFKYGCQTLQIWIQNMNARPVPTPKTQHSRYPYHHSKTNVPSPFAASPCMAS